MAEQKPHEMERVRAGKKTQNGDDFSCPAPNYEQIFGLAAGMWVAYTSRSVHFFPSSFQGAQPLPFSP